MVGPGHDEGLEYGGGLGLGGGLQMVVGTRGWLESRGSEGSSCTLGEGSEGAMVAIFVVFGNDYHPRLLASC